MYRLTSKTPGPWLWSDMEWGLLGWLGLLGARDMGAKVSALRCPSAGKSDSDIDRNWITMLVLLSLFFARAGERERMRLGEKQAVSPPRSREKYKSRKKLTLGGLRGWLSHAGKFGEKESSILNSTVTELTLKKDCTLGSLWGMNLADVETWIFLDAWTFSFSLFLWPILKSRRWKWRKWGSRKGCFSSRNQVRKKEIVEIVRKTPEWRLILAENRILLDASWIFL